MAAAAAASAAAAAAAVVGEPYSLAWATKSGKAQYPSKSPSDNCYFPAK